MAGSAEHVRYLNQNLISQSFINPNFENGKSKKQVHEKRALNLFGSNSSASEDEAVPLEWPQKCPRESPLPKAVLKPSVSKGIFG